MVIFSTKFFDFRLVKNHFRFSAMKSKNEIFDFDFVRFRKPLKNPVETSFYVLLFIFYLSLEYLWFWNIYTLVFLSLFLLAQNFFGGERGDEKQKNGGGATIRDTHPGNENELNGNHKFSHFSNYFFRSFSLLVSLLYAEFQTEPLVGQCYFR